MKIMVTLSENTDKYEWYQVGDYRRKTFDSGIMDKIIGNTRSCVRAVCIKENTGSITISGVNSKAVWSCSEDR